MATITVVDAPVIIPIAEMGFIDGALGRLVTWVAQTHPECYPELTQSPVADLDWKTATAESLAADALANLFPHGGLETVRAVLADIAACDLRRQLTDNELLVELCGRLCYDAETQVLTKDGWTYFPDLSKHVAVATLNRVYNCVEFQEPTHYVRYTHKGSMYCVDSRAASLRVTPDHELWHKDARGVWGLSPALQLAGAPYTVQHAARYAGEKFVEPGYTVPLGCENAWAAFLGHVIAEGTLNDRRGSGSGSSIVLYQNAPRHAAILACLDQLDIVPHVRRDTRNGCYAMHIGNARLCRYLIETTGKLSQDKKIPRYVFDWPLTQRETLLDALMCGDGTLHNSKYRVYGTSSKQLAEDVQLLITLSGRSASMSAQTSQIGMTNAYGFTSHFAQWSVREHASAFSTINGRTTRYKHDMLQGSCVEEVFCVSVPNRILLTRRHNKVTLCANCYMSFGAKAGTPTNKKYIENTQHGVIPHRSLMYHPKMTFFLSGVSRRLTHELVRHYVGADRSEEGSPSQESTRYVEHPGWFVAHPYVLDHEAPSQQQQFGPLAHWRDAMQHAYDAYSEFIFIEMQTFRTKHNTEPKGLDRKRIYEAASSYLPHSAMTSLMWTTNPAALAKLFVERTDIAADLEFRRLANQWKALCQERWPNVFWE